MEKANDIFGKIADHYCEEKEPEMMLSPENEEVFRWVDLFWKRLHPKPERGAAIKKRTNTKIRKISIRIMVFKYAAVIILLAAIAGIRWLYPGRVPSTVTIVSQTGEIKEIMLPDGSKVWLNAQSKIVYAEKFNRSVTIKGEAYFDVAKDLECPFLVEAGPLKVTVSGTRFLVNCYPGDPVVNTWLEEGSVQLEYKNQVMKLIPGDDVYCYKGTTQIVKENRPGSNLGSWRFGKLSFYNKPLFMIVRDLERKFGREIVIAEEKVKNMNFTGDFEEESLEEILAFICESSGIGIRTEGDVYIIETHK